MAMLCVAFGPAVAHNNPQFTETLIETVEVMPGPIEAGSESCSESFTIPEAAEGTIGLVWRVQGGDGAVRFHVEQDGAAKSIQLNDGKMTGLMAGDGYTVVSVTGTDHPFTLEIYAAARE